MPVILPRSAHTDWLDPELTRADAVKDLLSGFEADLSIYPVSTFVNSPANNSARCIEPLTEHGSTD